MKNSYKDINTTDCYVVKIIFHVRSLKHSHDKIAQRNREKTK